MSAKRNIVRSAAAVFALSAICHCESTPQLNFTDVDAASTGDSASGPPGDSAPDAPFVTEDAGAHPDVEPGEGGGLDASMPDASADAGALSCPGTPPPGASACCNAVACKGACKAPDCQKCETQCAAPGLLCCSDHKPLTCVPVGTACP